MKEPIIAAKEISKVYDNGLCAVNKVTLELHLGHFYLIMGRSGAGKTTLLQILSLLDSYSSGYLSVNGNNVSTLNESDKARIRMKNIGFVFQSYYLNEKMMAFENVMLPMYINPAIGKNKPERAMHLLADMGLSERANNFPRQLSGGEQQRVAMARSLANNPDCIFADEPTGNLDTENEANILSILKKISREDNKCVIVVSHNEVVKQYADTVFHMRDGVLFHES